MRKTTRNLIAATKADLKATRAAVEPMLAHRPEAEFAHPEIRFIQAAQNTLRTCLEATLQEAGEYSPITCVELAIRLASYAISALPLEHQDEALNAVTANLPSAHSARLAKGVIIQTEWITNGLRHANVPGGRA